MRTVAEAAAGEHTWLAPGTGRGVGKDAGTGMEFGVAAVPLSAQPQQNGAPLS